MTAQTVRSVLDALTQLYPEVRAELDFTNPYETLIATILSAQCTDKRVNQVTPALFAHYPDAFRMAKADQSELEQEIHSVGFYHNKAKNIIAACQALVERHAGQVPNDKTQLMALPGVGQKTAGVVLLAAFGDDQIPVDTHVFRVSNRIGLAHADTPSRVEEQLRALLPKEEWSHAHHLLIWHGRRCCHARKPECERCPVRENCAYYQERENDDGTVC